MAVPALRRLAANAGGRRRQIRQGRIVGHGGGGGWRIEAGVTDVQRGSFAVPALLRPALAGGQRRWKTKTYSTTPDTASAVHAIVNLGIDFVHLLEILSFPEKVNCVTRELRRFCGCFLIGRTSDTSRDARPQFSARAQSPTAVLVAVALVAVAFITGPG